MLNDADITFPPIRTAAGEELELTKGRYVTFLESPDRSVREQAFKNLYSVYSAQKNTIAATYAASVKAMSFSHRQESTALRWKWRFPMTIFRFLYMIR